MALTCTARKVAMPTEPAITGFKMYENILFCDYDIWVGGGCGISFIEI